MTTSFKVEATLHFPRGERGRRQVRAGEPPKPVEPGRLPRVTRLMALAIRFDTLLREGKVRDQVELANLSHVSRARITQIMNLLQLAPDIQEALLFLPRTVRGMDPIREPELRPIAGMADWRQQRRAWRVMTNMSAAAMRRES